MGRPTLATQRREQIIAAFCRCIAREGLEKTTLDHVATEAGVQRAAIRHYVGNRNELVRAALDKLASHYVENFFDKTASIADDEAFDYFLDTIFQGQREMTVEDAAFDALVAASVADESIRERLLKMYRVYEKWIKSEIARRYPKADQDQLEATAFSILCLAEQSTEFLWLGFPAKRSADVRRAVQTLLEALE